MKNIADYLDSTYLKTPEQSGLSHEETKKAIFALCDEASEKNLYAVMIRPEFVREAKAYLAKKNPAVKVGTVIGFHEGTSSAEEKFAEAEKAIADGADDLDFVINYEAYKKGELALVKDEFLSCTDLGIRNAKTVKWIIEIAALSDEQIGDLTRHISKWAAENFSENDQKNIFVKSSTGFYQTENGKPNGATVEGIKIMKANAGNLPIKAAGGVRTPEEVRAMIDLGVTRIGTSSAAALLGTGDAANGNY